MSTSPPDVVVHQPRSRPRPGRTGDHGTGRTRGAGLAWSTFGFGPFEVSINGFGTTSAHAGFEEPDVGGGTFTIDTEPSDPGDADWILGSLPDGYVSTSIGILTLAAGGLLLVRAWRDAGGGDAAARRDVLTLTGAATVLAGLGLVWIVVSYLRIKRELDSQLNSAGDEDPLAAAFLGAFDLSPGTGLLLEGAALAGVALVAATAFLVTLTRLRIALVPTGPTGPARAPAAPPTGAWSSGPDASWPPAVDPGPWISPGPPPRPPSSS